MPPIFLIDLLSSDMGQASIFYFARSVALFFLTMSLLESVQYGLENFNVEKLALKL